MSSATVSRDAGAPAAAEGPRAPQLVVVGAVVVLTVLWSWPDLTSGTGFDRTTRLLGLMLCPVLCLAHVVVPARTTRGWLRYLDVVLVLSVGLCLAYVGWFAYGTATYGFRWLALGALVFPPLLAWLIARHRRGVRATSLSAA